VIQHDFSKGGPAAFHPLRIEGRLNHDAKERKMAKGQKKSNREIRKPKAEQPKKTNASNPSTKGSSDLNR
jgi:hypothetical protein